MSIRASPVGYAFEEMLSAVDSLNCAYGVNPIEYANTKGIGNELGCYYADQFGAKFGSNLGKNLGSSLGVITANPVVGVVGYLGGRYIGGVAGAIAASWLAGKILSKGAGVLMNAPTQVDENTTVGEIHNIVLNRLHTNGEVYMMSDGTILFDKLYDDIWEIENELGIDDALSKDIAYRSDMKIFCLDICEATEKSFINNENNELYLERLSNSLIKFDIPVEEVREFRALNDKLIVASSQLNEEQALSYAKDFEQIVDDTNLSISDKSEIKTIGSISIHSIQYWK